MKKIRLFACALALVGAGLVSACATGPDGTVSVANPDGTTSKVPPLTFAWQVSCGAYSQAKAPLQVASAMGALDATGQAALKESMAGADQICADPTKPPANPQEAIALVNRAAAAVLIAVAQASGKLPTTPTPVATQ